MKINRLLKEDIFRIITEEVDNVAGISNNGSITLGDLREGDTLYVYTPNAGGRRRDNQEANQIQAGVLKYDPHIVGGTANFNVILREFGEEIRIDVDYLDRKVGCEYGSYASRGRIIGVSQEALMKYLNPTVRKR